MNVLGIKIDDINQQQALERVESWLSGKEQRSIVTPNPEIVMAAQSDHELKKILNQADLSIPDGIGLKFAGVRNRITGIDFMLDLVKLAAGKGYSVGFIGGKLGVAEKTAEVLMAQYPQLHVSFAGDGGEVDEMGKFLKSPKSLKLLNCDILFVAFGHGKQEKWIARYLPELPVKVAMTVGGALDYISGEVPRAPKFLRDLGLEWLFRLILQPWRFKRQLSLLKFLWHVLKA